jgi:hypothetical protein
MGPKEVNKTNETDGNTKSGKEKRLWWFQQPAPIDRFTGWLVAYTLLLFIATGISACFLHSTDEAIHGQLIIMKSQLDQMKVQTEQAYQRLLATQRPWIVIPEIPEITNFANKSRIISFAIRAVFKNVGPSPAANGRVTVLVLRSIDRPPSVFVKDVTNERPDCPIATKYWRTFNTMSVSAQDIPIGRYDQDVEGVSPYILICARYDWSLDRNQNGHVIMLYRLEDAPTEPHLSLLGSYAG